MRQQAPRPMFWFAALVSLLLLAAPGCGGGGPSTTTPTPVVTPPGPIIPPTIPTTPPGPTLPPVIPPVTPGTPPVLPATPVIDHVLPRTIESESPTVFEIRGQDFGATGDLVVVRFRARSGTPFGGGSSDILEIQARVTLATQIHGTSVEAGLIQNADADVSIHLANGTQAGWTSGPIRFTPPRLTDATPSSFAARRTPASVELNGSGFGPVTGHDLLVRLVAQSGRFFANGTPRLDIVGRVTARGTVAFTYPAEANDVDLEATVRVQFPSGAGTNPIGPLAIDAGQKLTDPLGLPNDAFGSALVRHHDWLVVGAPDADGGKGRALVYLHENGSWQERQTLEGEAGDGQLGYGSSLAMFQRFLAVGAPGSNGDVGLVYLYAFNGVEWELHTKLEGTAEGLAGRFGAAVALMEGYLAVGAPEADGATLPAQSSAGACRVYGYDESTDLWSTANTLHGFDGIPGDAFGAAVALSHDRLLVGAPAAQEGTEDEAGVVYTFFLDGSDWLFQDRLTAGADAEADAAFGAAVALDGDLAVIGSPAAGDVGAAYVFRYDGATWTSTRFEEGLPVVDAAFGISVSIHHSTIAIGAPGNAGGRAYVTQVRNALGAPILGPLEMQLPWDPEANDGFASAVSIWGAELIAGAPAADDHLDGIGAVYAR